MAFLESVTGPLDVCYERDLLRDLVSTKNLGVYLMFRVPRGPSLIQHRVAGTLSQKKCSQKIDRSCRTTARKQEEISRTLRNLGNERVFHNKSI